MGKRISTWGPASSDGWAQPNPGEGITHGDRYTLEFIPHEATSLHEVKSSKPEDILGVNVEISADNSPEEIDRKMKFYQQDISDRYGIPVRYFSSKKTDDGNELIRIFSKRQDLEQKVSATASVIGLISGIFFLSNFSKSFQMSPEIFSSSSVNWNLWLGIFLIIVGISAGIFWLKKRK